MEKKASAFLEFEPGLNQINPKKQLRQGLSVSVQVGNSLWVANDETITLERLTFQGRDVNGNITYGKHIQFDLTNFLTLPILPTVDDKGKLKIAEIDIEGLDCRDGYLWLIGSHSSKRAKLDSSDFESIEESFKRLRKVTREGNRFLLARIPLEKEGDSFVLKKKAQDNGRKRTVAQLVGGKEGNELTEALLEDKHLKDFLNIPGKDNGFDIEGLAVAGDKIFVGLRGPVLRGWAFILELRLEEEKKNDHIILKLKGFKKHALQLDGLGIRDIAIHGSDLLILTGPTMDLDGPVRIYRWEGGVDATEESVVFKGDKKLTRAGEIAFGEGSDHAEGIALLTPEGSDKPDSLLVVYDSASSLRNVGVSGTVVDVFSL